MTPGAASIAAADVPAVRAARLAPYLYTGATLAPAVRAQLRPDYLAALARHHDIKRELVPLIAAWRAAGIDTLLYKGFYLSEFVYPVPGARFHGDVDILLRPEQAAAALRIALATGWLERFYPHQLTGMGDGAFLFELYRPHGATQLDVHQLLVRATKNRVSRQRRITDAVWANAELRAWEGTAVRVPAPVDALLVLILERAVGDDGRGLKPYDRIDAAQLTIRGRVQPRDLSERARKLGVPHTAAGFLRRFRLLSDAPSVPPPSGSAIALERLKALRERWLLVPPRSVIRVPRAPGLAADVLRVLPLLVRVRWALWRHRDVRDVLGRLTPAGVPARSSPMVRWRTLRAIWWACRLLPLGERTGRCLVQALGAYAALREQGWVVEFVSGVRRDASGLRGHAWVEEQGVPVPDFKASEGLLDYRANFRYPASG